jgi:amino acid adenylation domain-containing protein
MSIQSLPDVVPAAPVLPELRIVPAAGECLHDLVSRAAEACPDAPALCFEGSSVRFREVEARANQMAHYLRGIGVGVEDAVGVFLPRGAAAAVAALAIWKAGGVYVPLDPALPQARVGTMVEQAGAAVVVTSDDWLGDLPMEALGGHVVCVDSDAGQIAAQPETAPDGGAVPGSLAYVIFTSGSTGAPKGVAVEHAAAASNVRTFAERCGYTPADRALLFASLSFDVSVEQLLAPLSAGACVVVREPGVASAGEFLRMVQEQALTVLNLPPGYWAELCDADDRGVLAALRLVIVGGDVLRGEAVRRWRARGCGGVRLLNAYGPTETAITASLLEVAGEPGETVRLGPPLPGRTAAVVDGWGDPLPAGADGELWLGGIVARGYLRRPALTAERFVPDPRGTLPGARAYRTGDVVREEHDGTYTFRGRTDGQVKVRGLRIELGEIEAALAAHTSVREAVVVVRSEPGRENRLAAFVVARGAAPTHDELLAALRETLPDYMVPPRVTVMDAFPLLPSGKADRRALAALTVETDEDAGSAAFATSAETRMAALWTELLGVPVTSPDDDFFELGGDSLLATQLVARLDAEYGVDVPMREVFDASTIREVASLVESLAPAQPAGGAAEIPRAPRDGDGVPLSSAQELMWVSLQMAGTPGWFYNIAGGLRLRGPLSVPALEGALTELVRRHEPLRTAIVSRGDSAVQVIHPPRETRLEPIPVVGATEEEAERRLGELSTGESEVAFDLAEGAPFRTVLYRLGPDHHVLWVVVHHIVSDGSSLSILFRDLGALYAARVADRPAALPELPYQFADFALSERERLAGGALEPALAFWRGRLSGSAVPARLPGEAADPAPGRTGATLTRVLPPPLASALRALGSAEGATVFMVLLAAWKVLFHHLTGQADVVVGFHLSGRNRAETEPLVGYFVNVLPLRTGLDGNPTFREVLGRVREATVAAYAHQDVPFERIVDELKPVRAPGEPPFFRTVFAMQSRTVALPSMDGVEVSLIEPEERSAKFELTLFASEGEDGIRIDFNYRTERFPGDAIERASARYTSALAEMLRNPDARMSAMGAALASAVAGARERRAGREDELLTLLAGRGR